MFDENGKYIGEDNDMVENEAEVNEAVEAADEIICEEATIEDAAEVKSEPLFTDDFATGYEKTVKPKKKRGVLKPVLVTALCACVAGAVFSTALNLTDRAIDNIKIGTTQDALSQSEEIKLSYSALTDVEGELSIEKIAEACLPSVVSITNKGVSEIMTFFGNYQTESISSGSGIIIGENDSELLIVTNYHVVADSKELTVVFAHEESAAQGDDSYMNIAKIKGYDENKDLAVIAVNLDEISDETRAQIKVATIGNSDDIKLGSGVVAIGNALGYGQSVTHGIVSATEREITMNGVKGGEITNKFIQTDAAINSGNSGGALLNMKGELIGINSVKIVTSGVEGMGYAIPITDVEELISELMTMKTRDVVPEEKRGYLGIYGTDVTSEVSQLYGMPMGVFIQETIEGSPAEKSDLMQGDIVVKVDGVSVNSMIALQDRLACYEAGETVTLSVKRLNGRNYEDVDVSVTLGSKKDAGIEE